MKTNHLFPLILSLAACGLEGANSSGADSDSNTTGGASSIDPTIVPSGDATSTTGTTGGPETSGETSTTGERPCEDQEDCDEFYKCVEGRCTIGPCLTNVIQNVPLVAPNVVLVLDKSHSMVVPDYFWDHDEDPETEPESRWRTLHRVVSQVVTELNESMNFGVQLFPSLDAVQASTPAACVVNDAPEVPVAPMNVDAVLAGIPAADELALFGGTPAERGVASAVEHLLTLPELNEDGVPVERYVVLVTDGGANCSADAQSDAELLLYDEQFTATIEEAHAAGVKTFVIGVDIQDELDAYGTNPFEVLNAAASAGGIAKAGSDEQFYNAKNMEQLTAALAALVNEALPCTLPLDVPEYMEFGGVYIDGLLFDEPLGAECLGDGWIYTDESETSIELCGSACADYQTSGEIELYYECVAQG